MASYDIPEDHDLLASAGDFSRGREALAKQIRDTPADDWTLQDPASLKTMQKITADVIFTKLQKGVVDDPNKIVLVSMEGYHATNGRLSPVETPEAEEFLIDIEADESYDMLRKLEPRQRVLLMQYAFARRLDGMVQRLDGNVPYRGNRQVLQRRIDTLRETYDTLMQKFAMIYKYPIDPIPYLQP
jgi:hypothetical protein